jgi:hypothetical protein
MMKQMFLLICNGKPLALYVDKETAQYEMHICEQGDMQNYEENKYRIKTMSVVTHAFETDEEAA